MPEISILDRILLVVTAVLAGYQVVVGVEGLESSVVIFYTIGFGVLLIASLMLIILGYEALDSPIVIVVAAILPLSISIGLVWQFFQEYKVWYLVFALVGLLTIVITQYQFPGRPATIILSLVHGTAGLLIITLPFVLSIQGRTNYGFMLVGLGGALFSIGGLSFAFLRAGRRVASTNTIFRLLPTLLTLMTLSYVIGMGVG
jgi:hypothetical protein